MNKFIKLLHFIGLTMFLGSIITYIVISTLAQESSLEKLVFAREVISAGISSLTVPGIWLIVVTGVLMTVRNYGFFKYKWLNFKQVAMVIVLLNAYVIVIPAADEALELAKRSLSEGTLLEEFTSAYMKESIFGALNVLLVLLSMVAGIWKFRKKTPAQEHTAAQ